jgi:hypothetical protein
VCEDANEINTEKPDANGVTHSAHEKARISAGEVLKKYRVCHAICVTHVTRFSPFTHV